MKPSHGPPNDDDAGDDDALSKRQRANRLRARLAKLRHQGVIVVYKCESCHFVSPWFGSDYDTQLGDSQWAPGMALDCCDDSELRPHEAKRANRQVYAALMQLMEQGNRGAAKKLWSQLEEHSLDDLSFRDVSDDELPEDHPRLQDQEADPDA